MTTLAELAQQQSINKIEGNNFTAAHNGPFKGLDQFFIEHPLRKRKAAGKLFLKDHLGLNSMQVSLNKLPAGVEVPFLHAHKNNEELYIFVSGKGQMQIDGQIFDVEEGTAVKVAPQGMRSWRNNSKEDLYYVVIQAKEGSLQGDTFEDGVPGEAPNWGT